MSRRCRSQGVSLVETLIAAALLTAVVGAAVPLLAGMQAASLRGMPEARRVLVRDEIRAELERAADASAKIGYFDMQATVEGVRSDLGGGQKGGSTAPPDGYCLVLLRDKATWPSNFDAKDRNTWNSVIWWERATFDDPTTWYYACRGKAGNADFAAKGKDGDAGDGGGKGDDGAGGGAGGGGGGGGGKPPTSSTPIVPAFPTAPIDAALAPRISYGTGVRVGDALAIVGPLAVTRGSAPIAPNQQGDAVTFLRTEPAFAGFTLGAAFQGNSGVIRLVARDQIDVDQILALGAGDVLAVNGRTAAGEYATALASVTSAFHQVSVPSVTRPGGEVLFKYYEAQIAPPDSVYAFGLRNAESSDEGVDIVDDAAVALLDRAAPVVTYYTAGLKNAVSLRRVVGDPTKTRGFEEITRSAASPLAATITWLEPEPAAKGPGGAAPEEGNAPERMVSVRLSVPLEAEDRDAGGADALDATLSLAGVPSRSAVTLHYRFLGVTPPAGGGGGGGTK